jgi:RHS repeat-associated protein
MNQNLLHPAPPLRVYSPFGVVLEGRNYTSGSGYRYGFQAQEQDAELWEGAVNYKYRVEDPRLGRFFSVDPLYHKYPWNSTYAFSENIVVNAVELEGLECMYTSNYGVNPNRVRENLGDTNCDGIISQEEHDSAMLTLGSCAVVAGSVVAIYAVITYGIAAVGALVLEEAGEYAFEAITGIPVIVDPIDVCEQLIKKGAKKFATDVIVAGRQFGKDVPVVNIQYFAWNAKKYGENLANKLYDGIVKFGSRREVGNYANLGKLQKHLEQRNIQGYGFKDINQMQTYGKDFFKREGNEILEWTSPDGYIHRIDVAAQEYGVLTPNNEIMTVFKVTPGENSSFSNAQEYLEQQIKLHGKKD